MKRNRYITAWAAFLTVLCLICALPMSCLALSIPKATDSFYVNDFANLLNDETQSYINRVNDELYKKTGAQVVVTTVPSLEGASLEEYATTMFRQYGIGNAEKNNGVLLLLALEERSMRIEVGYGLEGALNDGKTGRIQDTYMIPWLKDNNWNEGLRNGFSAVVQEICTEYGIELSGAAVPLQGAAAETSEDDGYTAVGFAMLISAGAAAFFGKVFSRSWFLNLAVIVVAACTIGDMYDGSYAFLAVIGCAVTAVVGWAIVAPDSGGGYSSGSSYSSSYSSRSSTRSYSSSSRSSGGGGRSGGGGSSRKF